MRFLLIIGLLLNGFFAFSQQVVVPDKMEFAGIKLTFNAAGKKKVQYEVDQIRKNQKYFQEHVKLADIYFPVIEEAFKDAGFPDDFKYLALQESALKADAVSSSNAVGYWQFKEGTAKEVGLTVNKQIDERKNIYAASVGAAAYIAKTNLKLDNWIYSLLAYNVGPTGVLQFFNEKEKGVKKMEITTKTHWYVIKCLAHKIAFENEIKKNAPSVYLMTDFEQGGKTLKQVSKTTDIDLDDLEHYNKWISKSHVIPTDKTYAVILPMEKAVLAVRTIENKELPTTVKNQEKKDDAAQTIASMASGAFTPPFDPKKNIKLEINHLPAITAMEGDYVGGLALKAGVPKQKFARYNEITTATPLVPGMPYFLKKKKSKAILAYYTAKPGENLWVISQLQGVTLFSIRTKNRMTEFETVEPGRVLYLRKIRPEWEPVKIEKSKEKPAVDKARTTEIPAEPTVLEEKKTTPTDFSAPMEAKEPVVKKPVEEPEKVLGEQEKTTIKHVVEQGETLYGIARKYGVSVNDIMKWNEKTATDIRLGEELKIMQ